MPTAPAVLLLHQTPRSWAEYRDVLPLLGERFRAIAMDTAGFGDSQPTARSPSIEALGAAWRCSCSMRWASQRAHVVGHHTGGVIAVELAARARGAGGALVLSSTPFTDAAFRACARRAPADRRGRAPGRRQPPRGAVAAGARRSIRPGGPTCCRPSWPMRSRSGRRRGWPSRGGRVSHGGPHRSLTQPTLLLQRRRDPFAAPHFEHWRQWLPRARIVRIEGGGVALPDQLPGPFARALLDFLDSLPP